MDEDVVRLIRDEFAQVNQKLDQINGRVRENEKITESHTTSIVWIVRGFWAAIVGFIGVIATWAGWR